MHNSFTHTLPHKVSHNTENLVQTDTENHIIELIHGTMENGEPFHAYVSIPICHYATYQANPSYEFLKEVGKVLIFNTGNELCEHTEAYMKENFGLCGSSLSEQLAEKLSV